MQTNGFELLLPDGVLDYFAISKVEKHENDTTIYLQEKNGIKSKSWGERNKLLVLQKKRCRQMVLSYCFQMVF